MAYVPGGKCRTEGCGRPPSFVVAGTKMRDNCTQNAPAGMVNLKKCKTEGFGKFSSENGNEDTEVLRKARPGVDY